MGRFLPDFQKILVSRLTKKCSALDPNDFLSNTKNIRHILLFDDVKKGIFDFFKKNFCLIFQGFQPGF